MIHLNIFALCFIPEVFPFLQRRPLPQSCNWDLRVWRGTRHKPDEHILVFIDINDSSFIMPVCFMRRILRMFALVALTFNLLNHLWHELGACVHHNWINVNHVDVCWTLPAKKIFTIWVECFNACELKTHLSMDVKWSNSSLSSPPSPPPRIKIREPSYFDDSYSC